MIYEFQCKNCKNIETKIMPLSELDPYKQSKPNCFCGGQLIQYISCIHHSGVQGLTWMATRHEKDQHFDNLKRQGYDLNFNPYKLEE